ncbi:MAG: nitrate- and nitrite sensing domain-containing protein [Rhodocyclaceae bacterium]|nr:nitrate- and nitrite sensing domain-containing protein [Rhodocyclaceae bacterium]
MIRVQDIRMHGKLALVLVLPLCALLLLSGQMIRQEWLNQERLGLLSQAGRLSGALTTSIHALQAERGRSTAWLAAPSRSADSLAAQRNEADAAWSRLAPAWRNAGLGLAPVRLAQRRDELDRLRAQVDSRVLAPDQAIKAYSALIHELLGIMDDLATRAEDPVVAHMLQGLRGLARAKELAGQERAEGSRLLVGGAGSGAGDALPALITTQAVLLEQVLDGAPPGVQRIWRQAAESPCAREVLELRAAMLRGEKSDFEKWFAAASCRIDRLYAIEVEYQRHLDETLTDLRERGRSRLVWILALALLPILPSLYLIHLVGRNVTGTLRGLLNAMQGIAGGNFNVVLPPQSRDEFGRLSVGLDELRGQLSRTLDEQRQLLTREREQASELARRGQEIQAFAQHVATGDLRGRLPEGSDSLGQLAGNLNHMAEGLANLAGRVHESSSAMASTVSQLQSTVGSQSAGASEQAAAVTETMTTLEQIRATAAQTLDKAHRLGEMAEKARAEGERGRHAVEDSIAGIGEVNAKVDVIARTILSLNEWAQHIGEITGAVSGIARQLRLLSLNAAIEASKAGEAGFGFAVVAGEVKQLAEQSQEATAQVQRILQEIRRATDRAVMATEDGTKGVVHGLGLVERAGEVIGRLEDVVRDTSMASRQIVAAVRQEVAGIEQIATAMSDIHAVTSQFVIATGQTRTAASELGHLAGRLDADAGAYRL